MKYKSVFTQMVQADLHSGKTSLLFKGWGSFNAKSTEEFPEASWGDLFFHDWAGWQSKRLSALAAYWYYLWSCFLNITQTPSQTIWVWILPMYLYYMKQNLKTLQKNLHWLLESEWNKSGTNFLPCEFFSESLYLQWCIIIGGFSGGSAYNKEPNCQYRRRKRCGLNPCVRKMPWRRKWQTTPIFLPGESHGQRILAGYSPWRCRVKHNWTNTHTHTHTHTHSF